MLNTLNINLNTDIKNDRPTVLGIKLMSQDINNNQFIFRFTNGGESVTLDDTYTVEILTKFTKSGTRRLTTARVLQGYATWKFDTDYITQDETVHNFVYVRKSGSLVVSADANSFYFEVGLSEIDKDAGRVAELYDENYQKYLDEFKGNVDFEEIAQSEAERIQAEQARKEAETLREESYEQKVDTAIVEADVVEKVDDKVTELTPQINDLTAQLAQTKNQVYSKNTKKTKPMITFYLDDGHANDYDVVLPKASSLNIPLTISLHNSGDLINRPDDLKELVNRHGWEVHAHTVGNTDLRTLTLEEQKQTMRENKEFLENTFGFDVRGVCYPMGHSNSDTYVAAREYFDVGLESYYTRVPKNLPPIQTYGLQRIPLVGDLDRLKQMIDNIKENGEGWLVFYSHSALYNQAGSEKETLFALMDYAVASGVDVVTVGEAMEVYQNTLDIGDKVYSDKVAKIGSDGNVDFTDIPFVVDNDGYETINEKKGIDFLPNKITISYFNNSNIPFDSGRGTLYTDRLKENAIYVGADAVQTFSSHLGNSYVRKYGGGVWGEWTSTSGFNTARITGNLEEKPITEYPERKVTASAYLASHNTGISVGNGIGTLITMRLYPEVGSLNRQFFYPINQSSYYTRRWLGSNQWGRWERVSTNIVHRVSHDYGTLEANETKVFSFDIDGVSANDSVNVNFNYGLINGVIYYPFTEGYNAVKIKLTNVTSSPKTVGNRGTVINVTKTGM